ncbi:MAG: TonB-dependent receptor [Elusimicrobia bacterium]|nr:TonB-dependent receptor [Elusimicrobiota bacterium]
MKTITRFASAGIILASIQLSFVASPVRALQSEEETLFDELPIVNISAMYGERLDRASGIVSVITANDIKRMGARNLSDVFDMVPGIESTMNTMGNTPPVIRGVGSRDSAQVKFMVDGVHVNDLMGGSGFPGHADMLLEDVERIEFIRGPGSALYGENALAGVINVITKTAENNKGIRTSVRYGSFDQAGASFQLGRKGQGMNLFATLEGVTTNGYKATVQRDRLYGLSYVQAPGPANNELERMQASLTLSGRSWDLRYRRVDNSKDPIVGITYALTHPEKDLRVNVIYDLVAFKHLLNLGPLSLTSGVSVFDYRQEQEFILFPQGYVINADRDGDGDIEYFRDGVRATPSHANRRVSIGNVLRYNGLPSHDILLGINYDIMDQYDVRYLSNYNPLTMAVLNDGSRLIDISNTTNWNKNVSRYLVAGFAQDKISLLNSLSLTLGARYDKYNDIGDTFNPRASLVWFPTEALTAKLLYGSAFRAPNFRELYNINNPANLGDPNLNPEEISTYEAGAYYNFDNKGSLVGMNVFYNRVRNLMDLYKPAGTTALYWGNTSKVDFYGMEMEGKLSLSNRLSGNVAYAYLDGKDKVINHQPGYLLRNKASTGLTYLIFPNTTLNATTVYYSHRHRAEGDSRPHVPGYTIMNTNLLYERGALSLSFSIHNIFDRYYVSPDSSKLIYYDFPRSGRDVIAKAGYKF